MSDLIGSLPGEFASNLNNWLKANLGAPSAAFGTTTPQEYMADPRDGLTSVASGIYGSLENLARKNFQESEALRTGNRDQFTGGPALNAAMFPMGTGAVAGVPVKAGEAVLGAGPIRAYHGSPYDFNAFDASKIGTGEGAQAYGHGLYFAENEGVAKSYRDALAAQQNAVLRHQFPGGVDPAYESAAQDFLKHGYAEAETLASLKAIYKNARAGELEAALKNVRSGTAGRMYEVNINADPSHFLDWDKPIGDAIWNKIHPDIRAAADDALDARGMNPISDATDSYTGRELYRALQHHDVHESLPPTIGTSDWYTGATTEKRHVAEYLREYAQLPGIKYLDQGSRAAGDGSRNYVVFDPKIVEILRKYGIVVPGAGVAAAPELQSAPQE